MHEEKAGRTPQKNKKKNLWNKDYIFGKFLFFLTTLLFFSSVYIVMKQCILRWFSTEEMSISHLDIHGKTLTFIYINLFLLSYLNYLQASFRNPGFVEKINANPEKILPEKIYKLCYKCRDQQWKPPRAHHCKVCQKCVFRMDHHCDWVDNCVGVKNHKFFILFLFYTSIYCLTTFFLILMSGIIYLKRKTTSFSLNDVTWLKLILLFFAFAGLFFIFFCLDFLYDQYNGLILNQTTVESYQDLYGKQGTTFEKISYVFGNNYLTWWLPIPSKLDAHYLEILYNVRELERIKAEKLIFYEDSFKESDLQPYRI